MNPVERVYFALHQRGLKPRKSGKGYYALCPVHEGDGGNHRPSLTFAEGRDQPVVLTCHAGCSVEAILAALDLTLEDVLKPKSGSQDSSAAPPEPVVSADDAQVAACQDRLAAHENRLEHLTGQRLLDRRTITMAEIGLDEEGRFTIPVRNQFGKLLWTKAYDPDADPKYRLPPGAETTLYGWERLSTLRDRELILVVEGEFDVLSCRRLGIEAVSSTTGASTWRDEWSRSLERFEVIVCGDNDPAGTRYMKLVCDSLKKQKIEYQTFDWPEEAIEGEDASSWISREGDFSFRELVELARNKGRLYHIDLSDIMEKELEPIPWKIRGWLAEGDIAMMGGEPGAGKSYVLLDLAIALASGKDFLGHITPSGDPARVLLVDEENNERLSRRRLKMMLRGHKLDNGCLRTLPLRYLTDNGVKLDDDLQLRKFHRELRAFQPQWILMDSLIRFHSRDENSNVAMAAFYSEIIKPIVRTYDCGFVILHHLAKPSKEGSRELGHRLRGASDIRGQVDQLWGLEGDTTTRERTLKHSKCRWDHPSTPIRMEYHESDDGTSAWLAGGQESRQAFEIMQEHLAVARVQGMLRTELKDALEDAGFRAADRIVSQTMGKMCAVERVVKKREGRGVRYWLREYST